MEGGEVNFLQGTFVDDAVDGVAIIFLIVGGVVLDGGDDALFGAGFGPAGGDDAGEIGVFAEVFEVAAVDGDAADIEAGSELEVGAAGAGFEADGLAVGGGEGGVPGGGEGGAAGEGAGLVDAAGAVTDALGAVGHIEAGDAEAWDGVSDELVAGEEGDFFLEGELFEDLVGPFVGGALGILSGDDGGGGRGGLALRVAETAVKTQWVKRTRARVRVRMI